MTRPTPHVISDNLATKKTALATEADTASINRVEPRFDSLSRPKRRAENSAVA